MIKFLCPNGHQLSAPENLAGKAGKCPKCGTAFLVPQPEAAADEGERSPPGNLSPDSTPPGSAAAATSPAATTDSAAADAAASGDSQARATPAMGSGKGKAVTGEIFVFLCPNGHKLNGPPSMKGKPGQCPHFGAKFRIPADDDLELPDEEEVPTGESEDDDIPRGEPDDGFDFSLLAGGGQEEDEDVVEAYVEEQVAPPPPGPSGLGYIVGRLWEQRTEGSELEIFLNEGEIVAPDAFSEILSSSDYGVFAIQEGDGSFAVSVIPWSAVRRVSVRKLDDLPPQLF
jgi:hypothetical protein